MVTVLLGSNRISDCRSLIALDQQSLLKVDTEPLRLSLTTPVGNAAVENIQIEDNTPKLSDNGDSSIRVVADTSSVSVFFRNQLLVNAILIERDSIHVNLDLRPIGINVYSDAAALHIGNNTCARNIISNCDTAINLA